MTKRYILAAAAMLGALASVKAASAEEFYIGEPVVKEGMQFSPAYLTGIEMDRHPPGMSMAPNSVHVEIDIHAAKDDKHGFPEDAWIPYLGVRVTLEKTGAKYRESKVLAPMQAADGPHYANNFAFAGPGEYKITYVVAPPSSNGFIRHIDKKTGVPEWWKPITLSWTFQYPSKEKGK